MRALRLLISEGNCAGGECFLLLADPPRQPNVRESTAAIGKMAGSDSSGAARYGPVNSLQIRAVIRVVARYTLRWAVNRLRLIQFYVFTEPGRNQRATEGSPGRRSSSRVPQTDADSELWHDRISGLLWHSYGGRSRFAIGCACPGRCSDALKRHRIE
jgi:hypothetical protein